jgi:tRNA(Leu) C34 or U34 (ribose-2'-O)-methylase TrmL
MDSAAHVTIGLSDPKSPSNVGAVMRAAGCFGVDAVFYTGERYPRAARFNTDTKDAGRAIPLTGVDSLLHGIPGDAQVVCVELVEGAIPLPDFRHPNRACYLFGPEDGTLGQSLIDRADAVVYIPTTGSMNLAAAVNVVLYDRMAKSTAAITGDELIRRSRDTNNRTRLNRTGTTGNDIENSGRR